MTEKVLIFDTRNYFQDLVSDAIADRGIKANPLATAYLSKLLLHYIHTENLFEERSENGKRVRPTLAELYLRAMNTSGIQQIDLLKKLGDTSLYISGFFSESLNRKVIDVDYYVNMGETAFSFLAIHSEDIYAAMYSEFSQKFVLYMDILSLISQKANLQNNNDLLKLYENYQKTGSNLLKETLLEQGFCIEDSNGKKAIAQ